MRDWLSEQGAVTSLRTLALYYLASTGGMQLAVHGALGCLLAGMPEAAQEEARRPLLDAVADVYRSAGMKPPPWTKEDA